MSVGEKVIPSEVGAVTWGDENREKGRLTVLAKKTEHHGGDHAVRVVPICPQLRAILAEAFERAKPGVAGYDAFCKAPATHHLATQLGAAR